MTKEEVKEAFRKEVCEKWQEVDLDSRLDWYDLSIGFFLAKGLNIKEAHELASEVRYKYEYWANEEGN